MEERGHARAAKTYTAIVPKLQTKRGQTPQANTQQAALKSHRMWVKVLQ